MRILYSAPQGRCEEFVAWALRDNGVELDHRFATGTALLLHIRKRRPDVVLFSKPEAPGMASVIGPCSDLGILTVCWNFDLYWGLRPERGEPIPEHFRTDLLFTTDGGHDTEWKRHGYNHTVLRQGIHKPEHLMYRERDYTHDVAFVGGTGTGYHKSRNRLVDWLKTIYGGRFVHHTNTRRLALNRALSRVKVVVGDSYPTPRYWSNRVYEITGRGGVLLHPYTEGLSEEFADGLEYIGYDRGNHESLRDKIEYWISHDEEREELRRRGFERCGAEYTYSHRVATLLGHIKDANARRVQA